MIPDLENRACRLTPRRPTAAWRFLAGGVRVSARVTRSAEHSAVADIDFTDDQGVLVARLEGYESTVDKSLNAAFRRTKPAGTAA